jgi:hypothetical protein
MNTHALQTVLVALIVSVSAVLALRHVFPGVFRALQSSAARALSQPRRSDKLRSIGYWLQPAEAKKGGCGSGLGCASCGGCGTSNVRPMDAIPLRITPRPSHRNGTV